MNGRRWTAWAMIVVEGALFANFSNATAFPTVIILLALFGLWKGKALPMAIKPNGLAAAILAGFYLILWQFFPHSGTFSTMLPLGVSFPLIQTFLTLQAIHFFDAKGKRPGILFPLYGVIVLTLTGDMMISLQQDALYHASALCFAALAALFYSFSRETQGARPRTIRPKHLALCGIILCTALGLSWTTSRTMFAYQNELDTAFLNMIGNVQQINSVGFSNNARLGSIKDRKTSEDNATMLRVHSDQPPNYLRGKAYDTFTHSRWVAKAEFSSLYPIPRPETLPAPLANEKIFRLRPGWPAESDPVTVWPDPSLGNVMFTRLDSSLLEVASASIRRNDYGVPMRSARAPGASYGLYAGEAMWPQGLSDEMRTQLLQVPDSIPSEIHALAAELAEGNTMPLTKAAAVTEFFHSNFEYQLGIKIPQDSDPMTYFLLERPPAHCEYFASGAALLLRMAGVPCRYVTGFVAVERNESGGYWMARNRDAHAWVEAYDPVLGWFVVEATPAAGVPDGNEASRWAYMWDGFKHRLTRIRQAFTIPGLIGWTKRIASSLLHAVTTNPVVAFCIVILVASAVVITRRRRVWSPHREDDVDPTRASLRRLLAQVDQRLLKKGIFRNATETLHGYVRRLRTEHTHDIVATTAAEWYLNYARLIYGGHPTRTDIEQLQREIP